MSEPRIAPAYHVHDHSQPPLTIEADRSALVDVWPGAAPRIHLTELMRMYRLEGAAELEARTEWT